MSIGCVGRYGEYRVSGGSVGDMENMWCQVVVWEIWGISGVGGDMKKPLRSVLLECNGFFSLFNYAYKSRVFVLFGFMHTKRGCFIVWICVHK